MVIIGNFDGVHRGHQDLLARARDRAAEISPLTAPQLIVVTFWPHPMKVILPDRAPQLLMSLADRIEALKVAGADQVRVVQFTSDLMTWAPERFVNAVLVPLAPKLVMVGRNFTFGAGASGTAGTLARLGEERFQVEIIDLHRCGNADISSTLVRHYLVEGDVEQAAELLGRWFRARGVVVMGDQRGRDLGFPTANLVAVDDMAVPADGVYAGWLTRVDDPGNPMPAAISVGINPTFDGMERRIESYVLDRTDLDLYGVEITVDFVARLRGMVRFDSIEALIAQMSDDVAGTREMLRIG